jgi:hypothetical protein
MSIKLAPEHAEAWDLYFSTAVAYTAPRADNSRKAVETAAALADLMLVERQARIDAHNDFLRG